MRDAISIQGLWYSYRSDWAMKERTVLKDISLFVKEGESFGFIGHNGAGKTTTMKCILNLCKPKKGDIRIFNIKGSDIEARKNIGYLPEQPYFYDNISVCETLHGMAELYGLYGQSKKSAVDEVVQALLSSETLNKPMRSLSKGQMQRVGLAQAILAKPRLLILDEPFSGLDPIGRKDFRDILLKLKKEGTTLFISSHVLADVEILCDRVSILVHGELKGVYTLSDLPSYEGTSFSILLFKSPSVISTLRRLSVELGAFEVQEQTNTVLCTTNTNVRAESLLVKLIESGEKILSYETQGRNLESLFVSIVQGSTS